MQQRYYDPVIGRFYSNDPVGFTASNPMMFNRYAYGNNNPYKFVDPDGREPFNFQWVSQVQNPSTTLFSQSQAEQFNQTASNVSNGIAAAAPSDPAGVALEAVGVAFGAVTTPLGGAVVSAVSADQLVSAWTGDKSMVETVITDAASAAGFEKNTSETIGKVGNVAVSLVTGGAKSLVDTVRQTGNIGDAAGATSLLKDTAKIAIPSEDKQK